MDDSGKYADFIELNKNEKTNQTNKTNETSISVNVLLPDDGWFLVSVPLQNTSLNIYRPGTYTLKDVTDEKEETIGQLRFILVDPPELTKEKITAIRSDPLAAKAVQMQYSCNACDDGLGVYAALEKDEKLEDEGYVWYEDIEDEFVCSCGQSNFESSYIKKNLYGLLGIENTSNKQIGFVPLYESSALEQITNDFQSLIDKNPKEEIIQKLTIRTAMI